MSDFSNAPGIVALAAAGIAVVALLWAAGLTVQRAPAAGRAAGRAGEPDRREDLVGHAADAAAGVRRAPGPLRTRSPRTSRRAWGRPSTASTAPSPTGRSSATTPTASCPATSRPRIALLDAEHNGVVLSSIAHRDSARLYCKQVIGGEGELELSPEEAEAVRLALAGELGSHILD